MDIHAEHVIEIADMRCEHDLSAQSERHGVFQMPANREDLAGRYTARSKEFTVPSPAFRRFFARISAKAGTTNIGHFFLSAV